MLSDSVEPQYISARRPRCSPSSSCASAGSSAARAIVDEALDRIQYCTEDAARIARIAAAGVAVEAAAAEHARDLGDAAAEGDALHAPS